MIFFAVGDDVVEVMVGPVEELVQDREEGVAAVGEDVLDARRHLGIDGAVHQPVGLQAA